jgi:hypothetical protein
MIRLKPYCGLAILINNSKKKSADDLQKKEKNKEYMNFSTACVFIGALHCLGNQCPNFSANKIYSIFVYFFERNICVYFGDYACSERIWSKESNGDWPHPFFY